MNIDELVSQIEDFLTTYDPYGFYDTYDSFEPNDASYDDIKSKVISKDRHIIEWFQDVAENGDSADEKEAAAAILEGLTGESPQSIQSSFDLFGEDNFPFTRADEIEYIETPLEAKCPEITSCRAYIDYEDDLPVSSGISSAGYYLSVDIITDDYEFTGGWAPSVKIDMRKIRTPSDLSKYLQPIIDRYHEMLKEASGEPEDPTQGDEIRTPWGGLVD